jgi:hypothetical protein
LNSLCPEHCVSGAFQNTQSNSIEFIVGNSMSDLTRQRIGGTPIHVKDCYIWAEIYYLDSSTDYREYLTQSNESVRPLPGQELVMLDDITPIRLRDVADRVLSGALSLSRAVIRIVCGLALWK